MDLLHQGLSAFTHAREKMATCLAKAVERGDAISLPELSEDSMDAFCLACDKAGEELVNACGAVESACRMCRQGLALLDFKKGDSEVELFLPMLPKARHLSKTLLLHAACHSAVKIVKSKAAQRGLNDSARKAQLGCV